MAPEGRAGSAAKKALHSPRRLEPAKPALMGSLHAQLCDGCPALAACRRARFPSTAKS